MQMSDWLSLHSLARLRALETAEDSDVPVSADEEEPKPKRRKSSRVVQPNKWHTLDVYSSTIAEQRSILEGPTESKLDPKMRWMWTTPTLKIRLSKTAAPVGEMRWVATTMDGKIRLSRTSEDKQLAAHAQAEEGEPEPDPDTEQSGSESEGSEEEDEEEERARVAEQDSDSDYVDYEEEPEDPAILEECLRRYGSEEEEIAAHIRAAKRGLRWRLAQQAAGRHDAVQQLAEEERHLAGTKRKTRGQLPQEQLDDACFWGKHMDKRVQMEEEDADDSDGY